MIASATESLGHKSSNSIYCDLKNHVSSDTGVNIRNKKREYMKQKKMNLKGKNKNI
jgi:hypothetical protein